MSRMKPAMIKKIREMLDRGDSTDEIVEKLGCTRQNVYTQRAAIKRIVERGAEPVDSESTEEHGLSTSDPDFWKVKYLEAHALLIEHGVIQ